MLSRFLEKRIEIEGQEIRSNPGNVIELEYYLVESDREQENDVEEKKNFGIQIIKKESESNCESILLSDVHPSREATEKLVLLLADNTVTPVTLPYIIDDLLGI